MQSFAISLVPALSWLCGLLPMSDIAAGESQGRKQHGHRGEEVNGCISVQLVILVPVINIWAEKILNRTCESWLS